MKYLLRVMSVIVTLVAVWAFLAKSTAAEQRDAAGNRVAEVPLVGFQGAGSSGPVKQDVGQWRPLGPFGGDVDDVNISPTSQNVMLAGIAPPNGVPGRLFRSTDSGATWTEVASFGQRSAHDIEFSPNGTAWVASDDSLWVSTDNGATFTQRNLGIGLNDQMYAVEIDPANSQVLWAAIADALGNQTTNVMKSVDG